MKTHDAPRRIVDVAVIMFAALVVRVAIVLLIHNGQYSDSVWYDATAAHLAGSGEYGPSGPSAWFPPGYPLFLSGIYRVFGHAELAGRLANALIGAMTCGFVYLIGATLLGRRYALVAAAILVVWPNAVFHTLILDTETLTTALFAIALFIGTRAVESEKTGAGRMILLGLVLGWAMLTRPVAAILFPAIVLYWWMRDRSLRHAMRQLTLAAAVATVVVLAWSVRNRVEFGQWVLVSTNGGYNFWQANNRYANGNDTFWASVPPGEPEFEMMRRADEFTRNREGYRLGGAFLRANPWHPVRMIPAKIRWLYHTDTSGLYEGVINAVELRPSALADWIRRHSHLAESLTYRYYFLVLLLAAGSLFATTTPARPFCVALFTLPLLLVAFHLFFHAKDRFHVPLAPVFALMASVSAIRLWDFIVQRRGTSNIELGFSGSGA